MCVLRWKLYGSERLEREVLRRLCAMASLSLIVDKSPPALLAQRLGFHDMKMRPNTHRCVLSDHVIIFQQPGNM